MWTNLHQLALNFQKCGVDDFNYDELNMKTNLGSTPLFFAVASKELRTVRIMTVAGSNINEKNKFGETPLHWATHGPVEIFEYLITKGAKINIKDNDGNSPLHWAAQDDNVEAVKIMFENGADIEEENEDFETAIEIACINGCVNTLKYLLHKVNEVDYLLSLACQNNQIEILDILIQSNLCKKPSATDEISAIYLAERMKHKKCLQLLYNWINDKSNNCK